MRAAKRKAALKDRAFSPGIHALTPNNDRSEREQNRAARRAAQRRTPIGASWHAELNCFDSDGKKLCFTEAEDDVLDKQHIMGLFQNCIRLAAENKINQQNTWDLRLIDHLSEVITEDDQADVEMNFQKASCTLEASIKIYSCRVDSVHSDAFKVLGGVSRTTADEEASLVSDSQAEQDSESTSVDMLQKMTTLATLESYDAINAKKFDVAFTIDPLFQQTSMQLDQGSAKALLLNTLSLYNGCMLAFDTNYNPSKTTEGAPKPVKQAEIIDLSFMQRDVQELTMSMQLETEISPTLRSIVSMLDDPYRAAAESERSSAEFHDGESAGEMEMDQSSDSIGYDWTEDNYESYIGTNSSSVNGHISGTMMEPEVHSNASDALDSVVGATIRMKDGLEVSELQTVEWLSKGLGLPSQSNSWVGPEHWRYRKDDQQELCMDKIGKQKIQKMKQVFSLDFVNPPEINTSDFAPASNKRSLVLAEARSPMPTVLPDDFHYQTDDLLRLFLQPSSMCVEGKRAHSKLCTDVLVPAYELWSDENGDNDGLENLDMDEENLAGSHNNAFSDSLLPHPQKVPRHDVKYDTVSKRVDVRALKEIIWQCLQEKKYTNKASSELGLSFKHLLSSLPMEIAAIAVGEFSVHLCLICLLHLANEHGLSLQDHPDLNELHIQNTPVTCSST